MPSPTKPHVLITAGPTREPIDAVRDWGNIFSGETGLRLALACLGLGNVTLLTSNAAHAADYDGYSGSNGMLGVETFRSHADLHALLKERVTSGERVDAVAMTAAVADYTPAGAFRIVARRAEASSTDGVGREIWTVESIDAAKIKSQHSEIAIVGRATGKLVDQFRSAWGYRGLLIKFKLEVGVEKDALLRIAEASRRESGADLMVANTLAMTGAASPASSAGASSGEAGAYLLGGSERAGGSDAEGVGGARWVPREALPAAVAEWIRAALKMQPSA